MFLTMNIYSGRWFGGIKYVSLRNASSPNSALFTVRIVNYDVIPPFVYLSLKIGSSPMWRIDVLEGFESLFL